MLALRLATPPAVILATTFLISCIISSAFAATRLPADEVEALREIEKALGKRDWNFSADPCGRNYGWAGPDVAENAVTCNCTVSLDDSACHVTSIILKSQNLPGILPRELAKLPFLQEIDLTRNFLNGTIPPEWASLPLVNISLLGNRLTGPIPKEFGNITTLTSLVVESNRLTGVIPPELGKLGRLERLILNSNNFSGELPEALAKLSSLEDFRISDNSFTGKIPSFIQSWTSLKKLAIQASGLEGPIPSAMSLLEKLSDLRISDINGPEQAFPPLNNTSNFKILILRSCNITGPLPDYIGTMIKLQNLDLSFNKLSGVIPLSYSSLSDVDFIYLTGNMITGEVPEWMLKKGENIDLSFNNLTSSKAESCQQQSLNLFKGSQPFNSGIASCLRSFQCPRNWYSFHINCGGEEVIDVDGTTTFEQDIDNAGPSKFVSSRTNWAFSNTGHFLDDSDPADYYIAKTTQTLSMKNSQLYINARISPLSLTYYGFCLLNGNYSVKLHFAEIMFSNNSTYESLGRRIFDVYIQKKLVLKNFNIEDKAGGVGKEIIKMFTVPVEDTTLEIRFQWAGKGTTSIPARGVYGPLISAISVVSDFPTPSENGGSISTGTVIGIVAAVAFVIFFVVGILWWKNCITCTKRRDQDLKGLDLQTGSFTLQQIKVATDNFSAANKIGEGGFGPVYKGTLLDGSIIAVKQLSSKSKQGNREFVNEIGMISALQHPHLVKLYGCCTEGNQLLLVYEYMENNSLARALFGQAECQLELDWPTRQKICVGIARGLAFLHEESRLKIVHRDIKATNVLLDQYLNPKISDFGLAKLDEEENTHISTRIAGTFGYMAPEYAMRGYLTDKADVYSFGIVALEIVSGRSNASCKPKAESFNLLDWAHVLQEKGDLMELIDPRLGSNFSKGEAITMIKVALLCTNVTAALRPTMSSVVSMLEGRTIVQELDLESSISSDEMKLKAMRDHFGHSHEQYTSESQTQSMSMHGPSTDSSTPAADLYPISLGSDYLEQRPRM